MQQRPRVDGDIFENAPRVDADIFYADKKYAFSKISGHVWTRPKTRLTEQKRFQVVISNTKGCFSPKFYYCCD